MHANRRSARGSWILGVLAAGALAAGVSHAADAPPASPGPSTQAHVVLAVHAWRDFLSYAQALSTSAPALDAAGRRTLVERTYVRTNADVRAYFAARGGGDPAIALGDWASLPPSAFAAVTKTLNEENTQRALEREAAELARRFAPYGAAGDTTVFVFLVGDFSNLYTTWHSGRTQVVAVQLERFVPAAFDEAAREAVELAVVAHPDSQPSLADVAPWAAFAATRRFVPELRERVGAESASLAEYALLEGFSARFAAALYPQSVFGRGLGAVRTEPARLLEAKWHEIGASWFPHGTKPYSAARYEETIDDALPEGTTLDQAISVVGAQMAAQWLHATRIGRVTDEPAQISRQGRVPTLSAWAMLQP